MIYRYLQRFGERQCGNGRIKKAKNHFVGALVHIVHPVSCQGLNTWETKTIPAYGWYVSNFLGPLAFPKIRWFWSIPKRHLFKFFFFSRLIWLDPWHWSRKPKMTSWGWTSWRIHLRKGWEWFNLRVTCTWTYTVQFRRPIITPKASKINIKLKHDHQTIVIIVWWSCFNGWLSDTWAIGPCPCRLPHKSNIQQGRCLPIPIPGSFKAARGEFGHLIQSHVRRCGKKWKKKSSQKE